MNPVSWTIIIILAAIALDAFLILYWRKRRQKEEDDNPVNATDDEPPQLYTAPEDDSSDPSQMQFTFDLTEGEKLQFTVEAPVQEGETSKSTRSRFRVTLDTIEGLPPATIELDRTTKRVSRSFNRRVKSITFQIAETSEQIWERISVSLIAKDIRKIGTRLVAWAKPLGLTLFTLSLIIYAVTHFVLRGRYGGIRVITVVNVLPSLDPYMMGYRDRDRYLHPKHYKMVFDRSGNATSIILLDGQVVGIWDLEEPLVKIYYLKDVGRDVRKKVRTRASDMGKFITGMPVQIKVCDSMVPLPNRTAGSFMSPLKNC